jgi:hypothetical protein
MPRKSAAGTQSKDAEGTRKRKPPKSSTGRDDLDAPVKKKGKNSGSSPDLSEEQKLAIYHEMTRKMQTEQKIQEEKAAKGVSLIFDYYLWLTGFAKLFKIKTANY